MSDQMVRWVTRIYIDGKFARWSDSEHNTEVMRDGTTRDTWSCAEDAWRDIWGWRKINRAGAAPGNERSRTTYRLVRLTRKPRAEKCDVRHPDVGLDLHELYVRYCRDVPKGS